MKNLTAAMVLVLASTFASAQQTPPPKPTPLPEDVSIALVVTAIFGASFYFYLECLTGKCRPVPCWMSATCKG